VRLTAARPSDQSQWGHALSNSPIPQLRIYLLGGFRLLLGDAPLTALDTPRQQALLAYLLLHRAAPQPRQRLAFLFWPDSTDAQAQTNLRQLLLILHRHLPGTAAYLAIDVGVVILVAAGLSFVGLGPQPPTADWGMMINSGRQFVLSGSWWVAGVPGLAIMLTALAFAALGDSLRTGEVR
jgi:hypothetical protein